MPPLVSHVTSIPNWVKALAAVTLLMLPWWLGGQLPAVQFVALGMGVVAFVLSLVNRQRSARMPVALSLAFCTYILIQYANPSAAQEWETGLRIWRLKPVDYRAWLPSSIRSDFLDASPLRFLLVGATALCCGLALYQTPRRFGRKILLPLVAVNAALIAVVALIQIKLGSRTILGLFPAMDEGLGLFYGTFLYKNHAAAFLNLGLAASLGSFLSFSRGSLKKSNPRWLFLLAGGLLLIGVVISRSRFGFLCSMGILGVFIPLAFRLARDSGLTGKWIFIGIGLLSSAGLAGGVYLLGGQGAKHLQTLNSNIVEDFSYKQRILAYQSELAMFAEKPIYGWGAGNFRYGFRQFQNMEAERAQSKNLYMERHELNYFWQHAHCDYLEWLIELGVVGTLLLAAFPAYFFWRIFKSKRWNHPLPLMLLAGLGSTLVHALIDFPFRNPAVLLTWVVMLIVTATQCEHKNSGC